MQCYIVYEEYGEYDCYEKHALKVFESAIEANKFINKLEIQQAKKCREKVYFCIETIEFVPSKNGK